MNPAPPIAMISDPTRSFVPGTTLRTVVVVVAIPTPFLARCTRAGSSRTRRPSRGYMPMRASLRQTLVATSPQRSAAQPIGMGFECRRAMASCPRCRFGSDGVEVPGVRYALEVVLAQVGKRDRRSGDECRHGGGAVHASLVGGVADSSGDGDGDPSDVVAAEFDFPGVEPSAEFESEGLSAFGEGDGASDGASGPVKGCQVTVAG